LQSVGTFIYICFGRESDFGKTNRSGLVKNVTNRPGADKIVFVLKAQKQQKAEAAYPRNSSIFLEAQRVLAGTSKKVFMRPIPNVCD
jgi:hypothetical protein